VAQVVECLLQKGKSLSSNPSTSKETKRKEIIIFCLLERQLSMSRDAVSFHKSSLLVIWVLFVVRK
jgi:hypothetical protein